MSAPQSARSGLTSAPENDHPADATLLAKLQQTATLANENCDRATALVRTLSAELRDAQHRIRDLEREAKGRQETEAALAQLQAEFDAESENRLTRLQAELAQARQRAAEASGRVDQIETEADERVARAEAEADERIARAMAEFARLKREAAEAQQRAEQAEAEAERIRREADEHVRRVEWDAEKSLEQLRVEARDEVSRLQFDLAEAEDRAKRAEQWVARIRQEVEGRILPAFARLRSGTSERPLD